LRMHPFLEALKEEPLLADGATGTYIFELTGRLSEPRHVYEALCIDQPELILNLHATYLRAGARCITTNTFSANETKLKPLGEARRLEAINRAAVKLAKEAIQRHREYQPDGGPYFILGSVGPLREGEYKLEQVKAVYRKQLQILAEEGVDAVLFETFTNLDHLLGALLAAQECSEIPPCIAHMSVSHAGSRKSWTIPLEEWIPQVLKAGARVVGVNCVAPWEAVAFGEQASKLPQLKEARVPLSAMPNAGGFERIDSRFMTRVNPEFMGRCARTLATLGVRLIGGCCEVHPPHIREMYNFLRAEKATVRVEKPPEVRLKPAGAEEKRGNGPFTRKILDRKFAVSVELLPPRGTGPKTVEDKVAFVNELAESGLADALDLTDGSRGIPLMPPADFIHLIRSKLGWTEERGDPLELIPHFTARDLNLMGIQSRLIGFYLNRIHNVLFITGDPPKMSPTYPRSTAVFDLDSVSMIRYAHSFLNAGLDFGGQPLGRHADPRTHFTIGTGFEPEALNLEREIERLEQKIEAGADYIMTQPAFRTEPLKVLEPYRERIPILVGVMILRSLEMAKRMAEIPGLTMPEALLERLARYESPADQVKVGCDIAAEQIRWIRSEGWDGLYLMSPGSHRPALNVLRAGLS